jgi:hypothetical protein
VRREVRREMRREMRRGKRRGGEGRIKETISKVLDCSNPVIRFRSQLEA